MSLTEDNLTYKQIWKKMKTEFLNESIKYRAVLQRIKSFRKDAKKPIQQHHIHKMSEN